MVQRARIFDLAEFLAGRIFGALSHWIASRRN